MSGNPSVQASLGGTVPNVQIQTRRWSMNLDIGSIDKGPNSYGVYIDTTSNWNAFSSYIPKRGEIDIYSDHGQIDDGHGNMINVPGIKIGDGSAYLIDLPFVGADVRYQILTELRAHSGNTIIHVTDAERQFWNNKLNCQVNDGNLILNRM